MGYGYAISGNTEEGEKALVLLENLSSKQVISLYHFATIYAGLGDSEKALEFLQRCVEHRDWELRSLKVHPFWDKLRDDPRFSELVKKVGLDK